MVVTRGGENVKGEVVEEPVGVNVKVVLEPYTRDPKLRNRKHKKTETGNRNPKT